MPSFDVVNRLDFQEIDNAIANVTREITNRYDFKGSETSIERKDNDLTVVTDDELKLNQVHDLIITHLVRRKVDPLCLSKKSLEKAGGNKDPAPEDVQGRGRPPALLTRGRVRRADSAPARGRYLRRGLRG